MPQILLVLFLIIKILIVADLALAESTPLMLQISSSDSSHQVVIPNLKTKPKDQLPSIKPNFGEKRKSRGTEHAELGLHTAQVDWVDNDYTQLRIQFDKPVNFELVHKETGASTTTHLLRHIHVESNPLWLDIITRIKVNSLVSIHDPDQPSDKERVIQLINAYERGQLDSLILDIRTGQYTVPEYYRIKGVLLSIETTLEQGIASHHIDPEIIFESEHNLGSRSLDGVHIDFVLDVMDPNSQIYQTFLVARAALEQRQKALRVNRRQRFQVEAKSIEFIGTGTKTSSSLPRCFSLYKRPQASFLSVVR